MFILNNNIYCKDCLAVYHNNHYSVYFTLHNKKYTIKINFDLYHYLMAQETTKFIQLTSLEDDIICKYR